MGASVTNGYGTIVFDLDGTLLDTLEDLHAALNHSLASLGLPTREFAETRRFVGNGIRNLVGRGVPEGTDDATTEAVFAKFNRFYAEHCNDATHPYPGMIELVGELRAEGRKVAVVSNKSDYAVQELMNVYFPGVFDAALGVREGMAKKPARDMVDAALAEMGGVAGRAAYVGDSEVDVATAANSGLDAVIVTWGFRDEDELVAAGARTLCRDVDELASVLRGA